MSLSVKALSLISKISMKNCSRSQAWLTKSRTAGNPSAFLFHRASLVKLCWLHKTINKKNNTLGCNMGNKKLFCNSHIMVLQNKSGRLNAAPSFQTLRRWIKITHGSNLASLYTYIWIKPGALSHICANTGAPQTDGCAAKLNMFRAVAYQTSGLMHKTFDSSYLLPESKSSKTRPGLDAACN